MKYLFIDTETSESPLIKNITQYIDFQSVSQYENSRLIELGYVIFNDNKELCRRNFIIKSDGFRIKNSDFHGITDEYLDEKGQEIRTVLDIFYNDLVDIDVIVAHNIKFDVNIILSECFRYELTNLIELITSKGKLCTMEKGREMIGAKRSPKLNELYKYLFGKNLDVQHRALPDAVACAECFYELKKFEKIIFNNHINNDSSLCYENNEIKFL